MDKALGEILEYYRAQGAPGDQNLLIALLRELQDCHGGIPQHLLPTIAGFYGIPESLLLALIRRIPSLRLQNGHCLELCAGPNCGKSAALASYAQKLQKATGSFTLKFVPCMRLCGKGPNLKWDGKLYHRADEALLRQLTDQGK